MDDFINSVETKSYKAKSEKKPKIETPIVIRRSLRTRGIPPDSKGLDLDATSDSNTHKSPTKTEVTITTPGPLSIKDAYKGTESDHSFLESLTGMVNDETLAKLKTEGSLELESLSLDPDNIARLVPGRITQMRFFPSSDVKMVVAGNKFGDIGFWNVGESDVFLFHPHQAPISGILVQPHCLSKVSEFWLLKKLVIFAYIFVCNRII